jgi:hypothetical protein
VYWTEDEHERFLQVAGPPTYLRVRCSFDLCAQALEKYGREWKKVEEIVGTKSSVQVTNHSRTRFSRFDDRCADPVACTKVFPQGFT